MNTFYSKAVVLGALTIGLSFASSAFSQTKLTVIDTTTTTTTSTSTSTQDDVKMTNLKVVNKDDKFLVSGDIKGAGGNRVGKLGHIDVDVLNAKGKRIKTVPANIGKGLHFMISLGASVPDDVKLRILYHRGVAHSHLPSHTH